MNKTILDLLPKKFDAAKSVRRHGDNRAFWYNQAIDDCIAALGKVELAIVPSVQELEDLMWKTEKDAGYIPAYVTQATAIRALMLNEVKE